MKPKYYPHLTVLAATLLTATPLCLVLAISCLWADGDPDYDEFQVAGNDSKHRTPVLQTVAGRRDRDQPATAVTQPSTASKPPASEWAVAAHDRAIGADKHAATVREAATQIPATAPTNDNSATEQRSNPVNSNHPRVAVRDDVFAPSPDFPIVADLRINHFPVMSDPNRLPMMGSALETSPELMVDESVGAVTDAIPDPIEVIADSGVGVPAQNPDQSDDPAESVPAFLPSPFEVSGQLVTSPSTAAALGSPVIQNQPVRSQTESEARSSKRRSRSGSSEPGPRTPAVADTSDSSKLPWPAAQSAFDAVPPLPAEDVILQHPLESVRVAQMESLVAVTNTKGWPVALVKSNLPGDYWWVQQMIGIRGNAFAAKINFGNEESISGSAYHLVIVFLDTADEMRRFQIAKQFKTLPEGLRKSRQFTFMRR